MAIDRHWTLVAANKTVPLLLAGIEPFLLEPPVNVLRLTLHPAGLAPRIANFAEWRSHLFARLRRQIDVTADAVLEDLLKELLSYPILNENTFASSQDYAGIAVPFQLKTRGVTLIS